MLCQVSSSSLCCSSWSAQHRQKRKGSWGHVRLEVAAEHSAPRPGHRPHSLDKPRARSPPCCISGALVLRIPSKASGWSPHPGHNIALLPHGSTLLSRACVCTAPSTSPGLGATGCVQHPAAFTPALQGQEETRQLLTCQAPGPAIPQALPFPAK